MAHGQTNLPVNGAKIRRHRELAGMNLRDLAGALRAAGYQADHAQISRYENGHARPRPRMFKGLTEVLGVKPEDLLDDDPDAEAVVA